MSGGNGIDFGRRSVIGTPVTPKRLLPTLAGSSFCVSFADPRDLDDAIELVGDREILLLDNGAFSIWKAKQNGKPVPARMQFESFGDYRAAFWNWANEAQAYSDQAVAVIPDVIEGSEDDNLRELSFALKGEHSMAWFPERVMGIWHLDESLEQLETMARLLNFVGFGSCAEFDVQTNRAGYMKRIRQASEVIDDVERLHGRRPWLHLMRGLGVFGELTRFDSADSTNVAVNHHRHKAEHGDARARFLADRIRGQVAAGAAAADLEDVAGEISNFADPPIVRPKL